MSASTTTIRIAHLSDALAVQEISVEAHVPVYQAIIGAAPKPAHENYWLARHGCWLNRAAGGTFVGLGGVLAASNQ